MIRVQACIAMKLEIFDHVERISLAIFGVLAFTLIGVTVYQGLDVFVF